MEAFARTVDKLEQLDQRAQRVGDGIDADDGVAGAEHEAVDNGGGDAGGIVRGMVGLEARGEAAGQADGGAEARDDADFSRDERSGPAGA